jgi:hypothetical protein
MNIEDIISNEIYEHGELKNSLFLLEYGVILLQFMERHSCTLNQALNGINAACQKQISDHKFSMR